MSVNDLKKQPSKKQKIGILGGTFDPIHNGHIRLAIEAFEQCNLDAVWFVPDEAPPWKTHTQWDIQIRIELIQIALESFSQFQINRVIPANNQSNYSVNTVLTLRKQYPEVDFFWILGSDVFLQIHRWHQTELFQSHCRLIIIERNNYFLDPFNLPSDLQYLANNYCVLENFQNASLGSWSFLNANIPSISSTMIRQKLNNKKDVRGWVAEKVWAAIHAH